MNSENRNANALWPTCAGVRALLADQTAHTLASVPSLHGSDATRLASDLARLIALHDASGGGRGGEGHARERNPAKLWRYDRHCGSIPGLVRLLRTSCFPRGSGLSSTLRIDASRVWWVWEARCGAARLPHVRSLELGGR